MYLERPPIRWMTRCRWRTRISADAGYQIVRWRRSARASEAVYEARQDSCCLGTPEVPGGVEGTRLNSAVDESTAVAWRFVMVTMWPMKDLGNGSTVSNSEGLSIVARIATVFAGSMRARVVRNDPTGPAAVMQYWCRSTRDRIRDRRNQGQIDR